MHAHITSQSSQYDTHKIISKAAGSTQKRTNLIHPCHPTDVVDDYYDDADTWEAQF